LKKLVLIFILCSCDPGYDWDEPLPVEYLENLGPIDKQWFFAEENVHETFKEFRIELEQLSTEELMFVGKWLDIDYDYVKLSATGEKIRLQNLPGVQFYFYPNKTSELVLAINDGSINRLETLIGRWEVKNERLYNYFTGIVLRDKESEKFDRTYQVIEKVEQEIIEIAKVDPLGFTRYRIQPISLSKEIELLGNIKSPEYRPFLVKTLDEYDDMAFPARFDMLVRYERMKEVGLDGPEDILKIEVVKDYYRISD
jgi:hypothetical protein